MSQSMRASHQISSRSVIRSQTFSGVQALPQSFRSLSVFQTSGGVRKAPRRSKMFTLSTKSPPPKVPQPERLDEVYEALKRGLRAYLQVHQLELENLGEQMRESKRNSRLGFLYELDKQVKVIERFVRRLEFHLSKVDELYEAYCMQRRLRDGASRMVKAYTSSPGSREARESLTEAHKGYREYTESMCILESELESQLGEFRIKMKGLAGFARLCAGDQYEIFMKYGRQRWKLRGRIEINGRQVWDSEEMVFMPLVTEFLSIKVTELKSLANHVVVGSVSCETKDLFTPQPQMVAVDINDLGTVKLSLEVTWNPFDKDEQSLSAGTVNKAPTVSKRLASYNQSPPDTPSLREQVFFNMLRRQEEMENGTAWSNSSESSDDSSSPQPSLGARHANKTLVQPELRAALPTIQISFTPRESTGDPEEEEEEEEGEEEDTDSGMVREEEDSGKLEVANGHGRRCRSLSHISESSADEVLAEIPASSVNNTVTETLGSSDAPEVAVLEPPAALGFVNSSEKEELSLQTRAPFGPENQNETLSPLAAAEGLEVAEPEAGTVPGEAEFGLADVGTVQVEVGPGLTDSEPVSWKEQCSQAKEDFTSGPGAVLQEDRSEVLRTGLPAPRLEDMIEMPRLQGTVQEVSVLTPSVDPQPVDNMVEEALKMTSVALDSCLGRFPELQALERELRHLEETLTGCSSRLTLTVEAALGSFDFLEDEEEEEEDGEGPQEEGKRQNAAHSEVPDSPCELVEMEGCEEQSCGTFAEPLTTGCQALDCALVVQLKNCSSLLQRLAASEPCRSLEVLSLECLSREVRALELLCVSCEDTSTQVLPHLERCKGAASLWKRCADHPNLYRASSKSFFSALLETSEAQLPDGAPGSPSKAIVKLAEQILGHHLPKEEGQATQDLLTVFQFCSYLEKQGVTSLDMHITELAKEGEETKQANQHKESKDAGPGLIAPGNITSIAF
ncbi:rho family-interacting cell polarization regulator 1-like isoform X2 [Paramormyrops kingsleyae]|uniref:RHO family interacting cell polarization regulator 1 n=2 Tax=Paramormyrops kingsleyae TaxID=1676925 RepID=A0A3B3Q8T0_9TELE|nr:rho family-interacting cell polarization regulator 2-like isoform X2 [Paramormyrops kingsleyae]XP_023697704.1 rho family-interacting cell polarization regulator 2-like isoform X2 [Paramormyrops kingsleyae]